MEFNKQTLFDNIAFLVKKHNLRIGELENASGVSPGYISRASKDGGPTPGIEFILKIADKLNVTIDTLILAPILACSPYTQSNRLQYKAGESPLLCSFCTL